MPVGGFGSAGGSTPQPGSCVCTEHCTATPVGSQVVHILFITTLHHISLAELGVPLAFL